jgi:hypothetical protein
MKSQLRPVLLLALYALVGVPDRMAAPGMPAASAADQQAIFPLALSYREDLVKRIESSQAATPIAPTAAFSPRPPASRAPVPDPPRPHSGTDLVYTFMCLRC